MELARALIQLWERRIWLAVGLCVATLAALASHQLLKSTVYAAASTQMVVDSPHSALGDLSPSLDPLTVRAGIFAQLMTSPQALSAIGAASGVPGTRIAAQGPPSTSGSGVPQAATLPTDPAARSTRFKLLLTQDPSLPTIDIYTEAPTTRQAISLANGAVTGFASYLRELETQSAVPPARRVDIRQLGSATGGVVDPSASTKLAGLIAVVVFVLWCAMILFIARVRAGLRASSATFSAGLPGSDGYFTYPASHSTEPGELEHGTAFEHLKAESRSG